VTGCELRRRVVVVLVRSISGFVAKVGHYALSSTLSGGVALCCSTRRRRSYLLNSAL